MGKVLTAAARSSHRRIPSKFDLRRFCRAVGATALASLGSPGADELGYAALLEVREVGGINVTVLSQVGLHHFSRSDNLPFILA